MNAGEILCFNACRKLVIQYKRFLDLLADLQADNDQHSEKLIDALREIEDRLNREQGISVSLSQHALQSICFDADKLKRMRKQILDFGNDLKRETETEFKKYNVTLK
jgi:hypothetical protein